LEPASVTRNRTRKSQRKIAASIEEQEATGDLERAEYREGLEEVRQLEEYVRSTSEAMLTKCSIILGRRVRPADETYIDHLYYNYGIEVKPLEHRQLRALDETLPCSSRRVNPFLQDVNIAMLAYAGLNGFSNIGDEKGMSALRTRITRRYTLIRPRLACRTNRRRCSSPVTRARGKVSSARRWPYKG